MQFSLLTLRNLAFVKHRNACECTTGNNNEFMFTKKERRDGMCLYSVAHGKLPVFMLATIVKF